MAVTIPSWLAWTLSAIVLNESYGPPCFGFGLIGICLVTFVVMFVPKSRQLSAIGKEGIYLEDHVADQVITNTIFNKSYLMTISYNFRLIDSHLEAMIRIITHPHSTIFGLQRPRCQGLVGP